MRTSSASAAEHNRAGGRQRRAAVEADRAVTATGDGDQVGLRRVADTLRLAQPGNPLGLPPGGEVDDIEAIVADLGDEKAFADGVHRHVVDPPGDSEKRDPALDHQSRFGLTGSGQTERGE